MAEDDFSGFESGFGAGFGDNARDGGGSSLVGQLLVAMPGMPDPRFAKSVIYVCAHNEEGAMGLVVNQPMDNIDFSGLLEQLEIVSPSPDQDIRVLFGGPVEQGRGFVLHTSDYERGSTLAVDDQVSLTATIDILRSIAAGGGPSQKLLALGYAGWGPGQLDIEILENGWLNVDADPDILFDDDLNAKWARALGKIGIAPENLSTTAGHA